MSCFAGHPVYERRALLYRKGHIIHSVKKHLFSYFGQNSLEILFGIEISLFAIHIIVELVKYRLQLKENVKSYSDAT